MITYVANHDNRKVERHQENGDWFWLTSEYSRRLVDHSPTGFGWGYGGSGPAQLALSLLLDVTNNEEISLEYYQRFKWDVISKLENGWTLTSEDIQLWLKEQRIKEAKEKLDENVHDA